MGSFNTAWLKYERYSKWLSVDRANKHAAFCRVCERVFLLTRMGIKAHEKRKRQKEHCDKKLSEESEFDNELSVGGRRKCYTCRRHTLYIRVNRKRNICTVDSANVGKAPIVFSHSVL